MSIAVVIPAYNSARFIAETLQSVLDQTLPPDEVIVVDDGSTDDTPAIVARFAPRVRLLQTANQRAAAARNLGVSHTSGEWIAFVDADDVWLPNKLERQMEELRLHPEADLCYTARRVLVQEGDTARLGRIIKVPPASEVREALMRNTTFLPSSVVIRRSMFLSVGGFRPEQRYAQDWELWMRLLHAGARFAACQEPLMLYRVHLNSMSSHALDSLAANKEVYRKHIRPHIPIRQRWFRENQFKSVYEADAAFMLREKGDRRCLRVMAASIAHSPFYDFHRYKVLAHMAYTRLRNGGPGKPPSPGSQELKTQAACPGEISASPLGPWSVSVVIPAYNAAAYLAETLESVLRQTRMPDEVLVIDDGSTDNTAEIARSFPSPVRVLRRANCKLAATRNFGVQEARGAWIAFLDADDCWEPNKLERQMQELAQHPEADLCYTGRVLLLQQGETAQIGQVVAVPPAEQIRSALFRNTTFLASSVVIRRATFLAIGGHDPNFQWIEDWETWLRLLHAGVKFAACPEPLVRYRVHPNSISHNAIPSLAEAKLVYRRHVLPYLPRHTRWLASQKSQSGQESAAAYTLRRVGDPRYLSMMARSIVRYPFNDPHRYKVLAHMLYTRVRGST